MEVRDVQRIIVSASDECRDDLQKKIVRLFDDIIVCGWRGRNDIIDISVGSVNKWEAVKLLANENNIFDENIISFGDASNDIELLRNSGIGVSMMNSDTAVKDYGDYITDYDNNDNGVYHFIVDRLCSKLEII